jgi:hypothetical protein
VKRARRLHGAHPYQRNPPIAAALPRRHLAPVAASDAAGAAGEAFDKLAAKGAEAAKQAQEGLASAVRWRHGVGMLEGARERPACRSRARLMAQRLSTRMTRAQSM